MVVPQCGPSYRQTLGQVLHCFCWIALLTVGTREIHIEGNGCLRLGGRGKAIKFATEGEAIVCAALGEHHKHSIRALSRIGVIYISKGAMDAAEEVSVTKALALERCRAAFGGKDEETAAVYGHLGSLYTAKGNHDKAIEFHVRAENIRQVRRQLRADEGTN